LRFISFRDKYKQYKSENIQRGNTGNAQEDGGEEKQLSWNETGV
jgi:hypothetical protein